MIDRDTDRTPSLLKANVVGGMPVVTVTGTPHLMGISLGRRLRPQLQVLAQECYGMLAELAPGLDIGDGAIEHQRQFDRLCASLSPAHAAMRAYEPSLWMELESVAEGAGLKIDDVLLVHAFTDLLSLLACPAAAYDATCISLTADHCEGGACLGLGWYLPAALLPHLILLRRIPDHGPSTLCLTVAGLAPIAGLCEAGFAVTTADLRVTDGVMGGVATAFQLSALLHAPTWEDALARLKTSPRLGGRAFHLLKRSGERLGAEVSGRHIAVLDDPQASAPRVHTNHIIHESLTEVMSTHIDPGSRQRLTRLARASREAAFCTPAHIERWFDPGSQTSRSHARLNVAPAAVAILEPKVRRIHLHKGPAVAPLATADL